MMARHLVLRRRMALQAHAIALAAQLCAMRLVAIAAGDACMVHAALEEGAVFIYLVTNLPVGEIQPLLDERDAVTIADRSARCGFRPDRPAPRMTQGASLDFMRGGARLGPRAIAG